MGAWAPQGDFVQLSLVTYGLHKQMKGPWLLLD